MYKKIKIATYLTGIIFTLYFLFKDGIDATHTPPMTFISAVVSLIVAVIWINIDYMCTHLLSMYKTKYEEHQISIVLNLAYILSIIFYTISKISSL